MRFSVVFLIVVSNIYAVLSENILILQLHPFKSHYLAYNRLFIELAKRGHNVTVIGHFPLSKKIVNYTDIDIRSCMEKDVTDLSVDELYTMSKSIIGKMNSFYNSLRTDDTQLKCKILKDITKIDTKIDLVMLEIFYAEAYYGFVNKFNCPYIILYANWLPYWITDYIGQPNSPSYMTYTHNPESFNMKNPTFYERLFSVYVYLYVELSFNLWITKKSEAIMYKHFGPYLMRIPEIVGNASMTFAFSSAIMNGVKPVVPAVIEVGGIHIAEPQLLPKNIEKFINESEHGVIYFCMGSLLRAETLPAEKRDAFLHAFSKIPQRVLWKWNGNLPGKMDKIMASDWMPQRDILAHPKVKLFISHGGALGINEAVYEGVPILGIPIYGDQKINIMNMVTHGVAEILEYRDISEETVLQKIQLFLNNQSYKENAKKLSVIYRDRPMSPLDTAVYWTEYVIRHKGAYHLKSAATNLSWYQYLLLDIIAFITICVIIVMYVIYAVLKFICRRVYRYSSNVIKKKQQ